MQQDNGFSMAFRQQIMVEYTIHLRLAVGIAAIDSADGGEAG
jgi:hypothetical protein